MVPNVIFINLHLSPSVQSWYIPVLTDELSNSDVQKQDVSSHFFPLRSQIYIAAKSFSIFQDIYSGRILIAFIKSPRPLITRCLSLPFGLIVHFSFLTSLCLCSQTGFLLRSATINHEEKLKYSYLFLLLCTLHIL